jgi:hypothetical protein
VQHKKRLVIINQEQFGYHTDTFQYCKYLRDDYEVIYIGFDVEREKIELDNVTNVYVPLDDRLIKRHFTFLKTCLLFVKQEKIDLILLKHFYFCSILKIFSPNKKYILDIRSSAIRNSRILRKVMNLLLLFDSLFFSQISIISESLMKKLRIPSWKCFVLPVGADILSMKRKDFHGTMRLLYVGTLSLRNIEQTIEGLYLFTKDKPTDFCIQYDIIGNGSDKEKKMILDNIKEYGLDEIVHFHGPIKYSDIQPFFDTSNIGVSYIPVTGYFNFQPPTKTFEYILSGLVCIATATVENIKIITDQNGVLCNDDPHSFADALESVYRNRNFWNSKNIQSSRLEYTWESIINNGLRPHLRSI